MIEKTRSSFPSLVAKLMRKPHRIIEYLIKLPGSRLLSDRAYLKLLYFARMGRKLDLKNPKLFSEKLQWLKLYDRNSKYTKMVDKYLVREIVSDSVGEKHLIPLLGVWDHPNDVDFNELPEKFVIKCNHNSGKGVIVCRDKSTIKQEDARKELLQGYQQNYYLIGREWPYKNVRRRIIAEKYITNSENEEELTDYKFFCFNGTVDCVMISLERSTGFPKFYFFNSRWELLRLNVRGKEAPEGFTLPKPKCFDEMLTIASKLSENIPFVRVDLYQSQESVFFGELTFFPQGGLDVNLLPEAERYFGNKIECIKERKT